MKFLSARFDLNSFFERFVDAPERILLLDYDGTLAPFQLERDQAFPYPGVTDLLTDIQRTQTTRIVIVTGRAFKDLAPLLSLNPTPEIWGSHGWEHIDINGSYTIVTPDEASIEALAQAKAFIESNNLLRFCEQKPVSLAIHWRGLNPEKAREIKTQVEGEWQEIAKQAALSVSCFDGGIELRVLGKDKGTAVESIVSNLDEKSMVAYLGDDITDEDAFLTLKDRGLNILVRNEFRPTAADLWLQPPGELLEFLTRWRQACSNVF